MSNKSNQRSNQRSTSVPTNDLWRVHPVGDVRLFLCSECGKGHKVGITRCSCGGYVRTLETPEARDAGRAEVVVQLAIEPAVPAGFIRIDDELVKATRRGF